MLRLFVAVPLPPMVRQHLALLAGGVPGARWVPPENLHLTLRFIGEVDEPTAEALDDQLARIRAPGFALQLSGVGHFGTDRRPTLLWAGVEPSPALQFLHDKVDRAVVQAGFEPDDRKFKPHITVARLNGAPIPRLKRWLEEFALFRTAPVAVEDFVLFRSHLGSEASVYEPLAEYPLERPPGHQPRQAADQAHRMAHEEPLRGR